ncbi:P-loop containing nucleoside triphosphate hydrolase protein [Annulohypoxylon stygium]|nr:P-loop containing nucleoside triphosphate hydrolase protein [Annulohypoxylon stygium]
MAISRRTMGAECVLRPVMSPYIGPPTRDSLAKMTCICPPEVLWDSFSGQIFAGQFSVKDLGARLSHKDNPRSIETYISRYPREQITNGLNSTINNHSVMAYVIDTDNPKVVELLLQYCPRLNAYTTGIPLLAFAIMRGIKAGPTNPEIIKLLLIHGADPLAIPQVMWQDYAKTPTFNPEEGPSSEKWYNDSHKQALLKTLDLSTRYYLWRAHHVGKVEPEKLQIGVALRITSLFKLPFQIVGQDLSVKLVVDTVFANITQNIKKPLVLALAGASGHGKTELAHQLGSLLSVPFIALDCTHLSSTWWLLGSDEWQSNDEHGAPLNNFLADNTGKRCVVLLDDFDNMNMDVKDTLLKIFDHGVYHDRRAADNKQLKIDCQKVIWLLATTTKDPAVSQFVDIVTSTGNDGKAAASVSFDIIRRCLEVYFIEQFSAAFTGRIDEIIPFLPFNKNEQAVLAHRILREIQGDMKRSFNDIQIDINEEDKICKEIARKSYKPELGARSIRHGMNKLRRGPLLKYFDIKETDRKRKREIQDDPHARQKVKPDRP